MEALGDDFPLHAVINKKSLGPKFKSSGPQMMTCYHIEGMEIDEFGYARLEAIHEDVAYALKQKSKVVQPSDWQGSSKSHRKY